MKKKIITTAVVLTLATGGAGYYFLSYAPHQTAISHFEKSVDTLNENNKAIEKQIADTEKIIKENAGKTIVICTHGDPFVLMEKILLDESYESLKKKMPSNKGKVEDFVRTYFAFSDRAQALNLHRPYIDEIKLASPTTGKPMTRIKEVLDVWMDSGSMPYAQMHYPFANKKEMEASFPADFIAEYVGQVRAWFYVMHVLGVLLNPNNETEPTPSFTNVITTGVINGNDGRKMSKSFGNYPDPRATIEKYGADPIRFYMLNSPLLSGGDMDFKEEGIIETIKNVMLPIWNTYSFFTTYANIDHWKKNETEIFFARHGESEANVLGKMSDGTDDPNLTEKGKIYLEIGYKQGVGVKELLKKSFQQKQIRVLQDQFGKDRMVAVDNG